MEMPSEHGGLPEIPILIDRDSLFPEQAFFEYYLTSVSLAWDTESRHFSELWV